MSFYNPYSKNIQWAQGFSDLINQFVQMQMMNKMFGNQSRQPSQPANAGQAINPGTPYNAPNMGPIGVGGSTSGQAGQDQMMRDILGIILGSRYGG